MSNYICYSLFLSEEYKPRHWEYLTGAILNIDARNRYFPGFILVYYIDEKLKDHPAIQLITKLADPSTVQLIFCPCNSFVEAVQWRQRKLKHRDPCDGLILIRDIDSLLTQLDADLVQHWQQNSSAPLLVYHEYLMSFISAGGGFSLDYSRLDTKLSLFDFVEAELSKQQQSSSAKLVDWKTVESVSRVNFFAEAEYESWSKHEVTVEQEIRGHDECKLHMACRYFAGCKSYFDISPLKPCSNILIYNMRMDDLGAYFQVDYPYGSHDARPLVGDLLLGAPNLLDYYFTLIEKHSFRWTELKKFLLNETPRYELRKPALAADEVAKGQFLPNTDKIESYQLKYYSSYGFRFGWFR